MTPPDIIDDLRLLEPPGPWWVPYAVVLAVIAVCALAWWLVRKLRARHPHGADAAAMRRAQRDAFAELERLFALIDSEQSRPYAIESSAIIRRYIETRFDLAAPLRSTEEFLAEARHSPKLAPEYQEALGDFLGCCDLLKFARTFANRSELVKLHEAALRFVKESSPREEAVRA